MSRGTDCVCFRLFRQWRLYCELSWKIWCLPPEQGVALFTVWCNKDIVSFQSKGQAGFLPIIKDLDSLRPSLKSYSPVVQPLCVQMSLGQVFTMSPLSDLNDQFLISL